MFEPFGELEFVDLHRDPVTGRSKGYAFVQWVIFIPPTISRLLINVSYQVQACRGRENGVRTDGGFRTRWQDGETPSSVEAALYDSLTGQLRVNTVHEKGSGRYTQQDSLEDSGGTCVTFLPHHLH